MRRSDYLTITEAAARFNVSTRTVNRRVRDGSLTAATNGRDRREVLLRLAELRRVFGEYFEADTKGKGGI